jgi:hypothetical protein
MNHVNYRLLTIFAKRIVCSASNTADADCARAITRFNNDQRRRLAAKANEVGRKLLAELATIVTPETLLKVRCCLKRSGGQLDLSVVVAMPVVRMVQMTFYEIVDMIAVRYSLVTAVRAVNMIGLVGATVVFGRASSRIVPAGRDLVVVHVVTVQMMHVAVVQIIGVAVMPHRSVPAIRTMHVCVTLVFCASHSCLLCRS